ncbi:MAG: carboxypeptidase M32 [Verrucomicrobia bacterium]|nr:carboxypeptidase M32 [Verrucomicrobiota bacterium]
MHKKKSAFKKLLKLSTKITTLQSIHQLLEWDQETYMPEGAIQSRSDQLQLLSEILHKQKTSSSYKKALSDFIDLSNGNVKEANASLEEKACAREWRRQFLHDTKLPSSFVKNFTQCTSSALHAWTEAKTHNNFPLFAPHLKKIVSLSREKAKLLGYKEHPYDALLDLYEPNLTVATLTPLFNHLKEALTTLLKKIQKHPQKQPISLGIFPEDMQKKTAEFLLKVMGFSKETSRLDLSSHPFCTGIHLKDARMTTRIDLSHPTSNIYSVLHEGGHALYHQNLPEKYYGTPLCEAVSYGVDESQSRLWETQIGKSFAFCSFLYPKLQEFFPDNFSSLSLQDFYALVNKVMPSEIRVEADEVTYSLHIILRFELEKGLMDGSIEVEDIPALWNAKMQEMLGITPTSDATGCLQDIHWAMGGLGYFPSYTLGNLLAAQLFSTIKSTFPSWDKQVVKGDVTFLKNWLKENIHQYGKLYSTDELIQKVTKKPLGAEDYIKYLQTKYDS